MNKISVVNGMNSDTHGRNKSAYQTILNQTSFSCHGACMNTTGVL